MNRDDATLEDALRETRPSRLDERLLGRLAVALEVASAPVPAADAEMEALLGGYHPARLPDGMVNRLTALAESEPKVVAMPGASRIVPFKRYAAAAAIALVGAAAALFAPVGDRGPAVADGNAAEAPLPVTPAAGEFVPAGYSCGFGGARDEGVIWKSDTAHRVLRIIYTDTITFRNDADEVIEVEQPRVEYILVPNEID